MIEARLFNARAFQKAFEFSRKNHTVVYLIYKVEDFVYAVSGLKSDTLESIPVFYTEHLYFWRRSRAELIKYFNGKLIFCDVREFLEVLNQFNKESCYAPRRF